MQYSFFDFLGNIGVGLILMMYLAIQAGKITSSSLMYSVCNGLGALLILISLSVQFNLSAFIIEFFWLLISLYGLYKNLTCKEQK